MLAALRYLDARLAEASTWSAITGVLAGIGVTVPSGLLQQATFWGMLGAALLGVLLREGGTKPAAQVALDVLAAAADLPSSLQAPEPEQATSPVSNGAAS